MKKSKLEDIIGWSLMTILCVGFISFIIFICILQAETQEYCRQFRLKYHQPKEQVVMPYCEDK